MITPRVIARLDIKAPNLVKGVHLEGLRIIGDPAEFALKYYQSGADEILYTDIVASLYGRSNILELVRHTAENIFIPITVGGGIRTIEDVTSVLRSGADKVSINTAGVASPEFLRQVSETFGSQCLVVTIETIRGEDGVWRVFTDNGREKTGLDAIEWAQQVEHLGAGEIILTSVDREGTFRGYEVEQISEFASRLSIPLVAHGGASSPNNVVVAIDQGRADAVAIAGLFHYGRATIADVKKALSIGGYEVRQ